MKRPSDLLRKRPFLALGMQAIPAIIVDDADHARTVWRTCFAHLAAGGLISRTSAYPMGLTAHFLIRSVERAPRAGTALSVTALHRAMMEEYRPSFDVQLPDFAVHAERWGSIAGFAVGDHEVRGAKMRTTALGDEAMTAFVQAMAVMAG